MKPSHKNLEKIIKDLEVRNLPKRYVLLGSYAIVERIKVDKEEDIEFYRDSKDLDLCVFGEDENELWNDLNIRPVLAGHYETSVDNTSIEIFTEGSFSDLGNEDILDVMFEKDEEGKFVYLDEIKISNTTLYTPKLPIIILMKTRAYEKRGSGKDRDDLALIRGYMPGIYNKALNELKKKYRNDSQKYSFINHLLEVHSKMFNNKT